MTNSVRARFAIVGIATVLVVIGAIGMAGLWFAAGREQRSTEVLGDYWREPLDEPPAVAITGKPQARASSTGMQKPSPR